MFRVDRIANSIQPLAARTFSELGFRERAHLQEWIAKYPSCLGEELLIIQKEFAGFSDTQERLDLLALDKEGRLVIIENKLDDTGRDVTWQALKYASYCASLKTESICSIYQEHLQKAGQAGVAAELIADFLEVGDLAEVTLNRGITQRIMLIAANFRKEVTSTVIWLMNFRLQVQCFKVTPWSMGDELFLNVEQIIPVRDTQEFVIGLADKAQDEVHTTSADARRHSVRREFWTELLKAMQGRSELYRNISPGTATWIGAGSGVRGIGFNFSAAGRYGRAELYIDRGEQEENKYVFDWLHDRRETIQAAFGGQLDWERLDHRRASRVKAEIETDIYDTTEWPRMIEFMADAMVRMERAMRDPLRTIAPELKARQSGTALVAEVDEPDS
ncbi:hypothetical protein ASC89_27785 [Devosia sp. Root413D1]|uniref:DUF4268 domain-containing protein n=1 Tax=Devosia sp. Root413D1 TaxID=1736531 RepID=UPI0006F3531D|nr:DUF4268 domain-containing protein [Devosia sp. Root413D1]KQW83548.1 hypothetical protein ASC89_27785 [Devosia sp. Root413D1]